MSFETLKTLVSSGNVPEVRKSVEDLLMSGTEPLEILNSGLIEAMEEIGEKFKKNEVYVPEVLMAARAMKEGVSILKPLLSSEQLGTKGCIVIGTVKGDLHDIGKNIVAIMLEGAGFKVIDLGVDVAPEKFLSAVTEHKAGLVAISALLTTTMPSMKSTVSILKEKGPSNLKIMVGGAPVTKEFAEEIQADGFSEEAGTAVDIAKKLISG
ncbi:corrinoid protein [bacterium]|jgi:5-methyltetrahydrofolate--homocysteine methyltransferase|nr:corrinoid protein [bacterium]